MLNGYRVLGAHYEPPQWVQSRTLLRAVKKCNRSVFCVYINIIQIEIMSIPQLLFVLLIYWVVNSVRCLYRNVTGKANETKFPSLCSWLFRSELKLHGMRFYICYNYITVLVTSLNLLLSWVKVNWVKGMLVCIGKVPFNCPPQL